MQAKNEKIGHGANCILIKDGPPFHHRITNELANHRRLQWSSSSSSTSLLRTSQEEEWKLFLSTAVHWGAWGVVWAGGKPCPVDIDGGHERFTHHLCSIHGHKADKLDGTCFGEEIDLFFNLGWLAAIILWPMRLRDFTWRLWRGLMTTNSTDDDGKKIPAKVFYSFVVNHM